MPLQPVPPLQPASSRELWRGADRYGVVVIGAGAAGVLCTAHLAAHSGEPIALVESSGRWGHGVAYGTTDDSHLLNSRAGVPYSATGELTEVLSVVGSLRRGRTCWESTAVPDIREQAATVADRER